jgi:hypothetical protein
MLKKNETNKKMKQIRNSTLLKLSVIILVAQGCVAGNRNAEPVLQVEKQADNAVVLMWNAEHVSVRIHPPVITMNKGEDVKGISLELLDYTCDQNKALLNYGILIPDGKNVVSGNYTIEIDQTGSGNILTQASKLSFSDDIRWNIAVTSGFDLADMSAAAIVVEDLEITGGKDYTKPDRVLYTRGVSAHSLKEGQERAAYFEMGINSTDGRGHRISMPVVGFAFRPDIQDQDPLMLAVSSDPYSGTQFYGKSSEGGTHISIVNRYDGSIVPVTQESRTAVLEFHRNGADGTFKSFYNTIPELEAAPEWVHDIALAYYDYNGDDGKGWYNDVDKLEEIIPSEHRKKIALCLHAWYNNIGFYCYDHSTGTMLNEWLAFANHRKISKPVIPMSKQEMHRKINYAKDRGFRVILYYADGMNCTGVPNFREGQAFVYENGETREGWRGPCGGGGPSVDPTFSDVQEWYLGYLEALLKEFGREIDGFVFDETNYFLTDDVSYRIRTKPAHAGRATMTLMRDLTLKVQKWREVNPDLVIMEGSHYFYGLVANGSFTDYSGLPLIINYRNASWTCSWHDPGIRNVHTFFRTDPDIEYPYGFDMGLSNGWATDTGPSEMDPEILDQVLELFMKRVQEGPERPKIKTIDGLDEILKQVENEL